MVENFGLRPAEREIDRRLKLIVLYPWITAFNFFEMGIIPENVFVLMINRDFFLVKLETVSVLKSLIDIMGKRCGASLLVGMSLVENRLFSFILIEKI